MIEIDPASLLDRSFEVVLRRPDGSLRTTRVEGAGLFRDPDALVADVASVFVSAVRRVALEDGSVGVNWAPVSWKADGALVHEIVSVGRDGVVVRAEAVGGNEVEAAAAAAFAVAAAMLESEPRFAVSSRGFLANLPAALRSAFDTRSFFAFRRLPRPADLLRMCEALERQGLAASDADAAVVASLRRFAAPSRPSPRMPDRRSEGIGSPCLVSFRVPWKEVDEDGVDMAGTAEAVVPLPGEEEDPGDWLRDAAAAAGIRFDGSWTLSDVSFHGPRLRFAGTALAVDADGAVRLFRGTVEAPDEVSARFGLVVRAALAGLAGTGWDGIPLLPEIAEAMSAAPSSLRIETEEGFDPPSLVNLENALRPDPKRGERGSVMRAFVSRLLAQTARFDPVRVPDAFAASKGRDGFRRPSLAPTHVGSAVPVDMDASARLFGGPVPGPRPGG